MTETYLNLPLRISLLLMPLSLLANPSTGAAEQEPRLALTSLLEEALARNPEVQAASRNLEMARARIPQAGALPDPILTFGVLNEGRPVPFETLGEVDFSEAYLGISQDIPYPGKRGLRERMSREKADASHWSYQAVRRRVVAEVKEAYYQLYAIDAALDIVEKSRQLLENLEKIAAARFSVGQGTQQDVLEAEVELSRLEERLSLLRQRRRSLEALLGSLLNRQPEEASFRRPERIHPMELAYGLEELWRMAEEASPSLREQTHQVASGESAVELARRELLPDLGVSFTYHNRGQLDPMYTFGGTLTLPLYAGRKQRKAIEEASESLAEARHVFDARQARVRYEVTDAYFIAKTAERLLRLYDEGILRQARLSLDSAGAQYQVGRIDFLTLLTSWTRLLNYDLAYHEQVSEHEKALARLEPHVGIELTSPAGEPSAGGREVRIGELPGEKAPRMRDQAWPAPGIPGESE